MSWQRLVLVAAVALYVAIFNVTYRDIISPVFDFWGMGYRDIPTLYFWLTAVLCVVPSMWMPVRFSRPSLLIFYMHYLLIYVPAAFLIFHSTKPRLPFEYAMQVVWAMFAGITIIQTAYIFPTRRLGVPRFTLPAFWVVFGGIAVIMLAYLTITLAGNFRLVSFDEVNTVRYAMSDIIAATGTRFGAYAHFLLLALFLPILFTSAADARKWGLVALVGATYIFIFGIGGAKQAALSLVYLPLTYFLLQRKKDRIPLWFIAGLTVALLSGYAAKWGLSYAHFVGYAGVVHFRLFTIPAFTIPQYVGFFQDHPVTHLSHVTGLNLLLKYPYDQDIAYTIGWYYSHARLGLNGGLWSTDGIAAFGIWGIPLISCLCAAVFWVLDSVTGDMDPSYVGVTLSYSAVSFTNVSIFTTLITGGLAFVMLAYVMAPRIAGRIPLPQVPWRGILTAVRDA